MTPNQILKECFIRKNHSITAIHHTHNPEDFSLFNPRAGTYKLAHASIKINKTAKKRWKRVKTQTDKKNFDSVRVSRSTPSRSPKQKEKDKNNKYEISIDTFRIFQITRGRNFLHDSLLCICEIKYCLVACVNSDPVIS